MKIVCDACSAKYSIADEKVRGKVFKIRCKKCSNIIMVKGTAGGSDPPQEQYEQQKETRVYDYDGGGGEGAVWHLVINQEQIGPMTEAEVRARFAAGEVDLDTYTWREGFSDWSPLAQVEPFTDLASEGAAAAAAGGMFGAAGADNGATTQGSSTDIFAGAGADGAGGDDDAASDLFGSRPSGGQSDALFGGAAAAQASSRNIEMSAEAEKRLRGERNENSVLFSLNNLAALASDSPKSSSAASPSSLGGGGGGSASGMAAGEGSGLIDIRSMASAYLGEKNRPSAKSSGSDDDLPVFSQSAFAAPAPVLLPTAPAAANNNKPLYIMLGVIGALVVAATVILVIVLKGGDQPQQIVVAADPAATQQPPATPPTTPAAGTDKPDSNAAGTNEDKQPADSKTETASKVEDDKSSSSKSSKEDDRSSTRKSSDSGSSKSGSSKSSSSSDSKSSSSSSSKTSSDSSDSSSGGSKCLDEVGCLLADKPPPCCSKYGGKSSGGSSSSGSGSGSKPKANLPESLSRSDISTSMNKIRSKVSGCGNKFSAKGLVTLAVKVAPGGSVSSVSVKSAPDPGLGNCVADATKTAKFPETQNGGSFSYPWSF